MSKFLPTKKSGEIPHPIKALKKCNNNTSK
jgi:hypothetical protein